MKEHFRKDSEKNGFYHLKKYRKLCILAAGVLAASLGIARSSEAEPGRLFSSIRYAVDRIRDRAVYSANTETAAEETEAVIQSDTEDTELRVNIVQEETETFIDLTNEEELEEFSRRLRMVLAGQEEGFCFPMEAEETNRLRFLDLEDRNTLHRYHMVLPLGGESETGMRKPLAFLQNTLEKQLRDYSGDWSVYVKNLNTDESFIINDRPMKSASIMKLFILGAVYKAFDSGELARTEEMMSLIENMITVSDNESANRLLYLLGKDSYEKGIEKVNEFIHTYGFSNESMEINGFNNDATIMDSTHFNQVTAKDCGKLLEDIYRRTWMSRKESNEMENLLLNQHTRYKIPSGLPEGVSCGNKTGEMDLTENDAAIIYAEDCDYILVVLSSDWNSKNEAIARIADISRQVYEFLQP